MSIPGTLQFPALAATPSPPPTGNYIVYTRTDNTFNMEDSLGNVYSFGSTTAISQLTGDVTAIGPGSAAATIEAIQGNAVSGTTGTGNVVFSASPTLTGTLSGSSAVFSSTISASNFSGSSSGTNTGDVTLTNTNSIDLAFVSGQTGLSATLNLSSSGPDAGYIPVVAEIKSDGLLVEVLAGVPVQIGTSNNIGSAASASRSDHVHAITSPIVLGLDLTGYTTGTNAPINATDSILIAFENLQAQISSSIGSAITSLTGDVTATGPGTATASVVAIQGFPVSSSTPTDAQILVWSNTSSKWTPTSIGGDATLNDIGSLTLNTVNSNTGTFASVTVNGKGLVTAASNLSGDATTSGSIITLDTVNSNVGSFGSSTAIPSFTVNAKGLITAASTNVVVAPAGTLTGTTLASNVINSSLTSVGTITSGVWNGTALTAPYMLALSVNEIYVGNGSGQPAAVTMSGDASIVSSGTITLSTTAVTGKLLTGYTTGTNTPILATNSILTAFENLQAQVSATVGSAITVLTGQVTAVGPGSSVATIATNTVTNSNLAQVPTLTLKGNNTGVTANVTDLTVSQVNTMLGTVTTIGAIDTNANSNALFISGNALSTQSASITNPGMVNTTIQSFAGNKTFTGTVNVALASISALVVNSTSFVHDSVNNALGIGVQPATSVMIDGVNITGTSKLVQMTGYGTGSTTGYRGRFARGTMGSPTAVQAGDTLSAISGRGYGASQFAAASTGVMNIVAGENFTNTSNMTYLQFQATPTGSVTSAEHMRVAATGVTLGPQSASTDLHTVNGGWIRTTRTITGNLTVDTTTTDDIIFCNQNAGITITLPTPTNGRTLTIVDISGNAQTNNITIARHASELIEGLAASKVYQTNYGSLVLTADASGNWWTIG